MDPNILLDTFSPEDMDIWQSYNLFVDDNINSSIKDQIKEENPDMMDGCFSSICPNDLINNNLDHNQSPNEIAYQQAIYATQPAHNAHYDQQTSTEYYSHNSSSSCSNSPSIICSDSSQYFEPNKPIQLSLDSLNFATGQHAQIQQLQQVQQQQTFIGDNNNFQQVYSNVGEAMANNGTGSNKVEYFRILSSSENETSCSPSSSMSSASSINGDLTQFQQQNQQFQKVRCILKIKSIQYFRINTKLCFSIISGY